MGPGRDSYRFRSQRNFDHGTHWIRRTKRGVFTVYRVGADGVLVPIASAGKIEDAEKALAADRARGRRPSRHEAHEDSAQDNAVRGSMSSQFLFPGGGWGAW